MKLKAYFFTLVFLLFSAFSVLTGLYNLKNFSNTVNTKKSFLPSVNYGIDIQGGNELVFDVNFDKYFVDYFSQVLLKLKTEIADDIENIDLQPEYLKIKLKKDSKLSIYKIREKLNQDVSADIDKDGFIKFYVNSKSYKLLKAFALEDFIRISRNRVDGLGVKEVAFQTIDSDKFTVRIPFGIDVDAIKSILSKSAKLSFHLISNPHPIVFESTKTDNRYITIPVYDDREKSSDLKIFYKIDKEILLTGKSIKNAYASQTETGSVVNFQLDAQGGYEFAKITQNNKGKALAIVVDDKLLTSPYIHDTIPSGSGSISGNFSFNKANELAIMLKSGSLPIDVKLMYQNTIFPSSGAMAIKSAKFALAFAVLLIMVFLVYLYGMLGVVANISMILNFFTTITIFAVTGFTLTLPGIAAMVLTLGMIVDANILIYERINETKIKNLKLRLENAYSQAIITITDSNLTTIIAALTLIGFGLGFIRSFGISIIIGSLTSIFYSCFITKYMIGCLVELKVIKKFKLS